MNNIDFNRPYERDTFMDFLQRFFLPEDFTPSVEEMDLEFSPRYIEHVNLLGECPDLGLNVYEIHHGSEHDPRVSLTKETFRLMEHYHDFDALAVFISSNNSNYRLSYMTMGMKPEGKKVTYEHSNPRRYSYFLGPDAKINTPMRFLLNRDRVKDMEDLRERFSVEVVNKEFYREIAELFTELVGGKRGEGSKTIDFDGILRLPSVADRKTLQEFAVRMIGRIVFCWFLKKKITPGGQRLIPENVLSLDAVKGNKNYYHSILEKLFFQVLNTPREQRREEFKSGSFADIPFLNGGLFEPHSDDKYELDPFSGTSICDTYLIVPDTWMEKLFELLERYNFTIDENTSMDVELSVDPEMLGRIFENLLAEINPETGETARKATGSYYTPRSIVEYMVDESLKQYLLSKTGLPEDKLRRLLSFSEDVDDLSPGEQRKIIDALDAVKIIDPACGSGAFPMGILQKMVLAHQKADPDLRVWKEKQLEEISNPYVRNTVEEQLKNEDWNYIRKMGIIQDSIYGVDIQQIAVEISKLRVFLSLVVDTSVNEDRDNKGIKPLPNLEFKFVCADSLVALPRRSGGMFEAHGEIKELKTLRAHYFNSMGDEKHRVADQFRETQRRMFDHANGMGSFGGQTLTLSEWDPFSSKPADWFDPEWMFGIKTGFDIVIANPPYVRQEAIKDIKPRLKKDFGNFYCGTADLYTYFYKGGLDLLRRGGHLCFIAPNKFMRAGYGKNTRRLLSRDATPKIVIDFGDLPIFEATTYPSIIVLENRAPKANEEAIAATFNKDDQLQNIESSLIEAGFSISITDLATTGWTLETPEVLNLIKKISNIGTPLGEYIHQRFYRGVLTGFNEAFVINAATRERLISEAPRSAELIKPWLRGRDVRKWKAEWAGFYIIAIPSSANKEWPWSRENKEENARKIFSESFPTIHRHISKWETKLRKRDDQGKFWWELRSCAYYEEFEKPKIIYPDIAQHQKFTFDENCYFLGNTAYIMPTENKNLIGILNSTLIWWYYINLSSIIRGGYVRFIAQYMEKLPIAIPSEISKQELEDRVNQILEDPEGPEVARLEKEIDQLVYELYQLTPGEIALVEQRLASMPSSKKK